MSTVFNLILNNTFLIKNHEQSKTKDNKEKKQALYKAVLRAYY